MVPTRVSNVMHQMLCISSIDTLLFSYSLGWSKCGRQSFFPRIYPHWLKCKLLFCQILVLCLVFRIGLLHFWAMWWCLNPHFLSNQVKGTFFLLFIWVIWRRHWWSIKFKSRFRQRICVPTSIRISSGEKEEDGHNQASRSQVWGYKVWWS